MRGNALYDNKPIAIGDISRCHKAIKHQYRNLKGLYISNKSFKGHVVMKGTNQGANDIRVITRKLNKDLNL